MDKLALITAAKKAIKKRKLDVHEVILDADKPHPCLTTGNAVADYTIGGSYCPGLPRGAFTELFGEESSGKTTWATQIAAHAVENKMSVLYLDYESAFNARYAKRLGLDIKSPYFTIYAPVTYEEGYWYVKTFMEAKVDLLVIDSLAAMTPKAVLEAKDMDKDSRLGAHASLTSLLLKRAVGWDKKYKSQTAFLILNQIRAVINLDDKGKSKGGGRGKKEKTTGGNALKFYMAVRLKIQPIGKKNVVWEDPTTKNKKYIPATTAVKLINIKNKVSDRQGFSDVLTLVFGRGFDTLATCVDIAVRHGKIVKNGSWYEMFDDQGVSIMKEQGGAKVRKFFSDNPKLKKELIDRVKALLVQADEDFYNDRIGMEEVDRPVDDDEFNSDAYDYDEDESDDPFGDTEYVEDDRD